MTVTSHETYVDFIDEAVKLLESSGDYLTLGPLAEAIACVLRSSIRSGAVTLNGTWSASVAVSDVVRLAEVVLGRAAPSVDDANGEQS